MRMPPPEQRKRLILLGAGGLGLLLVVWLLASLVLPGSDAPGDPDMIKAEKLAEKKDYTGFVDAIKAAPPRAVAPYYAKAASLGQQARPIYKSGWSHPDKYHQITALKATPPWLRDATDRAEVEAIVTKNPDPDVRRAALDALGSMKAWDSIPSILKQMDDPDQTVRQAAANAFEKVAYLRVDTTYKPDDLPGQRQKAIQNFLVWYREPGRREQYQRWLQEKGLE